MKTPPRFWIFALSASGWFLSTVVRADVPVPFGAPPYEVNRTIIGVAGWEPRLATPPPNPDSARVVAVRWYGYRPALMLKGANLKFTGFPATQGDRVKIRFDLALTFPDGDRKGKAFRLGFDAAPFGEVFFDQGPGGGLGYLGGGSGPGGTVALPKSEVRVNAYYTHEVLVDFAKRTFDLSITGTKKDGTPFSHQARGVAFEVKTPSIRSLYLITGGGITAYLGSLSIEAEGNRPE